MLCSICNKNTAVIFINKQSGDNKNHLEGLCYDCAKKRGINPLEAIAKQAHLSDSDWNDMSKQLESMFKDISENLNIDDLNTEGLESLQNSSNQPNSVPLRFHFFWIIRNILIF